MCIRTARVRSCGALNNFSSIESTLSIEKRDVPSRWLGQIPAGQKFLPMGETFAPSRIKTHAHAAGFYEHYGLP